MLPDWVGDDGRKHKGIIDSTHVRYVDEKKNYRNAWDKVEAVSPQKHRTEMCEEFFELMRDGVVEFPSVYDGKGSLLIENDKGNYDRYELTEDEKLALVNLDLLKTEITAIHRTGTRDTPKYELPKDKIRKMHDDRFFCLILLGRHLYNLRREDELKKSRATKSSFNVANLPGLMKKPNIRKR
jgi:hypothetical protein